MAIRKINITKKPAIFCSDSTDVTPTYAPTYAPLINGPDIIRNINGDCKIEISEEKDSDECQYASDLGYMCGCSFLAVALLVIIFTLCIFFSPASFEHIFFNTSILN